jgi:cytochrome c-type biogenesis protein
MMITGKMNSLTGYLSQFQTPLSGSEGQTEGSRQPETETAVTAKENEQSQASEGAGEETEAQENKIPALDFELEDQFGNLHKLSDYEGKTIFLNFWATWCPPCRAEMPDIQRLYEEYDTEGEDALIILGVAGPDTGNEKSREEIARFLEENGYTYPVLMDMDWSLFGGYGIQAFPTTFMIDREGNVFGYASGQLTYDMMKDIIHQTMEGRRRQ